MRLATIILAPKTRISHGVWSDQKLRSHDFYLSKKPGKVYPLTRRWRWRVSTFEACGRKFRLMPAYHTQLPEFTAVLAEETGSDCRVLARLEFHQSHVGWHAHLGCGDIDILASGVVKPLGVIRMPGAGAHHRNVNYQRPGVIMNDDIAAAITADFFKVPDPPNLFASGSLPWAG
jgi:hypothetical protein